VPPEAARHHRRLRLGGEVVVRRDLAERLEHLLHARSRCGNWRTVPHAEILPCSARTRSAPVNAHDGFVGWRMLVPVRGFAV